MSTSEPATTMRSDLRRIVEVMDKYLDSEVADAYKDQPLAQTWARVTKAGEEVGEAIDALIGYTGQNPRKGEYGSLDDLLNELADVALSGLYGLQHLLKDSDRALDTMMRRAHHHVERCGLELPDAPTDGPRDAQGRLTCTVCGDEVAYCGGPTGHAKGAHTIQCKCDGRGIVPGPVGGIAVKCDGLPMAGARKAAGE